MKQLRKKALLPALSMALASVIALSGVTYAWFTTSPTAQVTGMDVNVQTANGIQISLDANEWKSNITAGDITAAINRVQKTYPGSTNQYPTGEIAPVSTAGTVNSNGKMEMFFGTIDDGKLTTSAEAESETTATGNFIAFDLFVKSSSPQMLSLGNASAVNGIIVGSDSPNTAGTEKAVRVAFLNLGCAETSAAARALKGENVTPWIWEPNAQTRAVGVEADAGKLPYDGVKTAFQNKAVDALTDAEVSAVSTNESVGELFQLGAGINKVRVYIWLEGQDVDCVNQISFGDFSTTLAFSVPEVDAD